MSKETSLDKVRDTFVKLKENIDSAEDRQHEAKQAKVEAISRYVHIKFMFCTMSVIISCRLDCKNSFSPC